MKQGIVSKTISRIGLILTFIGSIIFFYAIIMLLLSPWIYYQPTGYYSAIKNNDVGDTVYIYGFYSDREYENGKIIIEMDGEAARIEFTSNNENVIVEQPKIEFNEDVSDKFGEDLNHYIIIKGWIAKRTVDGEEIKYVVGQDIIKTSQLWLINGYYYPIEDFIFSLFIGTIFLIVGAFLHIGLEHRTLKKLRKEYNINLKEYKILKRTNIIIRVSIVLIGIILLLIPLQMFLYVEEYERFDDFDFLDLSGKKEGDEVLFYGSIVDYRYADGKYYVIAYQKGSGNGEFRLFAFDEDVSNKIPNNPNDNVEIKAKIYDIEIIEDNEDDARFEDLDIQNYDEPFNGILFVIYIITIVTCLLWIWIFFTYRLKKSILWIIECEDKPVEVKFIEEV